MRFVPCSVYRRRAADGAGGWVNDFSSADATVFGALIEDLARTEFVSRAEEDVRLEDVIEVAGERWRVLRRLTVPEAPMQLWLVESASVA